MRYVLINCGVTLSPTLQFTNAGKLATHREGNKTVRRSVNCIIILTDDAFNLSRRAANWWTAPPEHPSLPELCEEPSPQPLMCRSPRWHCSADAGRRTPPLPRCSSPSLGSRHVCSLFKHLSPHICLTSVSFHPTVPPTPPILKAQRHFSLSSFFPLFDLRLSLYILPKKWNRDVWRGKKTGRFKLLECYQPSSPSPKKSPD